MGSWFNSRIASILALFFKEKVLNLFVLKRLFITEHTWMVAYYTWKKTTYDSSGFARNCINSTYYSTTILFKRFPRHWFDSTHDSNSFWNCWFEWNPLKQEAIRFEPTHESTRSRTQVCVWWPRVRTLSALHTNQDSHSHPSFPSSQSSRMQSG